MSSATDTRILFVGDMHLGRLPTSIPDSLSVADLGPRLAWSRVVQAAIDLDVHCVALAGDLVDGDNALFEAFGLLDSGVRRLADHGIEICAVAGNHDTDTLPRLADLIDRFHLLGPGGTWSTFLLQPTGTPQVRLAGWSFPTKHYRSSPLETSPPVAEPDVVNFGLLHADLDVGTSKYAPVTSRELEESRYQGWFLGHVHLPGDVPDDSTPFYLGSVSPLTPREQGLHGPLLVKVAGDGTISRERLPLAPLRWEELRIDFTGLENPQDHLKARFLGAINNKVASLDGELDQVTGLGLRLLLTGEVDQPAEFAGALASISLDSLLFTQERLKTFVQKITSRVTGTFDLHGLSLLENPAGLLARQILLLESGPNESCLELLQSARKELSAVDQRDVFTALLHAGDDTPPTDAELTRMLADAARRALADLLAGKEGGDAPL